MGSDHAPQRLAEGMDAGLEAFEEHDAHQAPQVGPGPLQVAIGRAVLLGCPDIMPQAIAGVSQTLPSARHFGSAGHLEMLPQLLIQPLVGRLDTVFNCLQLALGKELSATADQDVSPALPLPVGGKVVGVNALLGLLVIPVPAQDVVAGATDEQVGQQGWQPSLAALHQPEVLAQVGRIDRDVGQVVLVEKAELVVDVPDRLVARRGGEEHAAPVAAGQKALQHPIALVVGMAKVVAFVNEHKIAVAKALIVQHPLWAVCLVFSQQPHREDTGVELVGLVVVLPHLHQGRGADDERPDPVAALELFDDGRADVGFAQAHHVGHKAAAVALDHLHRPADSLLLELCQDGGDVVAPQETGRIGTLQLVADQFVEGLEIDLVRRHLGQGPGATQFLHQMGLKVLGVGPQVVEPAAQLGVVGVAVDQDVEFGVGGDAREGKVTGADDGQPLFFAR